MLAINFTGFGRGICDGCGLERRLGQTTDGRIACLGCHDAAQPRQTLPPKIVRQRQPSPPSGLRDARRAVGCYFRRGGVKRES